MNKQWLGRVVPYVIILSGRVIEKVKKSKLEFSKLTPAEIRKITIQQWKEFKQERKKMGNKLRLNSEQEKEIIKRATKTCQTTIDEIRNKNS